MENRLKTDAGVGPTQGRGRADYPRGVEVLLKKAKVDTAFREHLLRDPLGAASAIHLERGDSERRMLAGTPLSVLRAMIDSTFVPRHHAPTFRSHNVVAMVALVVAATGAVAPVTAGPAGETAEQLNRYWSEEAAAGMELVQGAIEAYRAAHGEYPSTEQWMTRENPLEKFLTLVDLHDPWKWKFHYQALSRDGKAVGYFLESWGAQLLDPGDNIAQGGDPEHTFPPERPISLPEAESADGERGILRAKHEDPDAAVEWYLDGRLVGRTVGTHKMKPDPAILMAGEHFLLVADDSGHYATRVLRVTAGE